MVLAGCGNMMIVALVQDGLDPNVLAEELLPLQPQFRTSTMVLAEHGNIEVLMLVQNGLDVKVLAEELLALQSQFRTFTT